MVLLVTIALVVSSGCITQNQKYGNGVKILEFGPDMDKVYPGEIVNFRVKFQNLGSVRAENVFAELLGLDEDWRDEGFTQGGPWRGGEKLPNEEECRYTSKGKQILLMPPDPVFGTGGEIRTCTWTYRAPANLPRDMEKIYPLTVRVFYDYRTDVVVVLPVLSREELINLKDRDKSIPLSTQSSTHSPIKIEIWTEAPIRIVDGKSVEFPMVIDIQNVGDGTPCLRGKCKKTEGGEWNKIVLKMKVDSSIDLGECESLKNGGVVDLYKGKHNTIKCYVRVENVKSDIGYKEIKISAVYSYFVDAESVVTVRSG